MVALADQHLAHDVSQEVAIRVLRNLGALRSAGRFDAWTYQITVAETRRAMRRQSRRRELYVDAPPETVAAADHTDHMIAAGELQAALAELSQRERVALALRYAHDLGDEEIARAMRCRPGTVRSLISRARSKLRGNSRLSQAVAVLPSLTTSPGDPVNSVTTFEELVRSAQTMEPAAADIDIVVAKAGRVAPWRPRLRRPGALVIAALLAVAVPSAAIAVTQLLSPDKVAHSLPAAQIWLQGTRPTCTTVAEGAKYDCTLASAPTDGPTNWHVTIENTVDTAGRLNGACMGANDSGTRWTC
jgi:RNA polymerase sigma factor (sigma-70 family)